MRERWWSLERIAVAILIVLAAANALRWVFVVPMFQAPDEELHFDYMISIYAAGRLIRTSELPVAIWTHTSPTAPNTHPLTHHLQVRSGASRIRSVPAEKVPPGYGSREFYRHVNETMPPDDPQLRNPWLIDQYPFGYYALGALWLRAISLWHSDPVTLFFASRVLSVLLLAISLAIGYAYLRWIGTSARRAIAIVLIAGFFPSTTFVASYVQPENLSLPMTMLACYLALVTRDAIRKGHFVTIPLLSAGLAMAVVLVTKYHFFLMVFVTTMPMLLVEIVARPRAQRRWLRTLALLGVPVLAAAAVQLAINHGSKETWLQRARRLEQLDHAIDWISLGGTRLWAAILNYFGGGTTFRGFWGVFGWNDTPLVIGTPALNDVIQSLLLVGSVIVLVLISVRLVLVARRLFRVARARPLSAARVALSNPLANSYFVFVLFMLSLYVWMGNYFHAVARNWFPYTLIIFWLAAEYAPRAVPWPRVRRALSTTILVALAVYSIVGAWYAIPVIRARFY